MLTIHQFSCLDDNYAFLARDEASGKVAVIDTPDGEAILAEAAKLGWPIDFILNTHWHPDHVGGNHLIRESAGAIIVGPAEIADHSPVDRIVQHDEIVMLGETQFRVIDVGGHTLGHIAYHAEADNALFPGDTLFPLGCGRIFEGTAAQMWESLLRLAALPEETFIYSAHEYTLANARFAVSVDASPAVAARLRGAERAARLGRPTVPTNLGLERQTNPFLHPADLCPDLCGDDIAALARLRAAKDSFLI